MSDNFVIDLTGCNSAGEIISNISIALELPEVINKDIVLNLKDFQLNQSQILSIKSLISSCGSNLAIIKTSSLITKQLCEELGIKTGDSYFEQKGEEFIGQTNSSQPFENTNFEQSLNVEPVDSYNDFRTPEEHISSDVEPSETQTYENAEDGHNEVNNNPVSVENAYGEECLNQESLNATSSEEESKVTTNDDLFREIYNDETALNSFGNFAATLTPDNEQSVEYREQKESNLQNNNLNNEINNKRDDGSSSDLDDVEKKVISVYTKADDENTGEIYEEVDFYAPKSDEPVVADSHNTMYVTQTLRNGQVVDFDGNVVIIGDCHPGSEIRATGDITVWGVLGSIAHAGIKGDSEAKIRALKINAVQLRIADYYSRRPDGSNIPYIVKSSTFTPEEARVVDGNIVLYKIV